jgi:hypothetical protein
MNVAKNSSCTPKLDRDEAFVALKGAEAVQCSPCLFAAAHTMVVSPEGLAHQNAFFYRIN